MKKTTAGQTRSANERRVERPRSRLLGLLGVLALLFGLFTFVARPWMRQWGATPSERVRRLPGDEIIPSAAGMETRAITIAAPAAEVWPWVAQLGQDRGGFYSFRTLENLVGCEMPDVDHLDRRLQTWAPGDKLWMYPPRKAGGAGFATLRVLVPGHALGFGTRQIGKPLTAPEDASWSFVVEPLHPTSTRLIVRGRGQGGLGLLGTAFTAAGFEPIHFVMERAMLGGIKARAEGRPLQDVASNAQPVLWTLTFLAFVASAALVVAGRQWRRRLATCLAAGLLFQLLTLVQPPVLLGGILFLAVTAIGWWPRRREQASPGRAESGTGAAAHAGRAVG